MTQTTNREQLSAIEHFGSRLRWETDPSDLHEALHRNGNPPTVVDSRGPAAWQRGRLPGAVHLPTARIAAEALQLLPADLPVVVYCWGPGCNGSTKAALALARLGFSVREMSGGFEYWAREGLPVETDGGTRSGPADLLTAPAAAPTCDC